MSTSTLPNIRVSSDLTVRLKLKDGGVAVDWTTLTNIRASIFSDAQRAKAGRCDVSIDETDHTVLVCEYSANKPQYLGVNRVIVSCTYEEETKTYDKPAFNFVRWTDDQAGREITIDDPDVDVEIEVEDISSSILQEAVDDAFAAADRANDAAAAAEHMTDIHQGPPGPAGKAPYIDETTGNWFVWDDDEDAYVDSEIHAQGVAGNGIASWSVVESDQDGGSNVVTVTFTDGNSEIFTYKNGHTGATPQITIGTVETGAAGSEAEASMTGTAAAPLLNLKIPKGDPGVAEVCYKHVTTLPTAAAGTMNALYLVDTQTANVYDVYYTSYDGSAYSWVQLGTTTVNLSDYATKTELNQLEAEVHNLSGAFYGVHATTATLPDNITAKGYAFVGAQNPYAIYNFDGTTWSDSGSVANGITGEPGVGFSSIFTPVPYDGTVIIVLSNNDTITLDLNHSHPGYYPKVAESEQPSGGFLPDVAYKLGELTASTLTFDLASPVSGNINHYFFVFSTGSTAPSTVNWPSSVTAWDGNCIDENTGEPELSASKRYEVSILDGVGYINES